MQPKPNPTPSLKGARDPRTITVIGGLLALIGIAAYLLAG
jgi:hypothetical protein